ncbi:hypothetical protein Abr02nite_33620 [Paractinoplanes brasiliensis]|nr:hypothetical protein Abr02nite_33620 [Actinoplanes brasiliensis]
MPEADKIPEVPAADETPDVPGPGETPAEAGIPSILAPHVSQKSLSPET